ncbi:MAG: MATE family efflux transporter [Eubacterium sp.]|nr:MATE family efflux transporter [Eubacterium sp.]
MKIADNEKMRQLMLSAPVGPLLFRKALPTVIIQLITVIYNTADTYFVAKISTSASAAVGIVFSLMSVIQAVGFGLGMGAGSIISRKLGAADEDSANRYASSAMAAGIGAGLLIMSLGLWQLTSLMKLIGARGNVLADACDYGFYILLAAPVMCMAFIFNNCLRAQGQTFLAMIGMTTGGIANLFLDPVFIFGLRMGTDGAALATMLSQILSCLIMGFLFFSGRSIVKIRPRFVSRRIKVYRDIVRTGFPTIARQGLGSLASAVLNIRAAAYGEAVIAAITIANKLYMLVRYIILGIGQGYQPIAGYCYGAGKKERVRNLFCISTGAGTVICTAAAVALYVFRVPVIAWFRNDPAVIECGASMLRFLCLAMPLMAFSTYVNQTYQCLGYSVGATFLASCRQGIFFMPLALLLPSAFGQTGIEMIQAWSDILTFAISVPFMIWFYRKHLAAAAA